MSLIIAHRYTFENNEHFGTQLQIRHESFKANTVACYRLITNHWFHWLIVCFTNEFVAEKRHVELTYHFTSCNLNVQQIQTIFSTLGPRIICWPHRSSHAAKLS